MPFKWIIIWCNAAPRHTLCIVLKNENKNSSETSIFDFSHRIVSLFRFCDFPFLFRRVKLVHVWAYNSKIWRNSKGTKKKKKKCSTKLLHQDKHHIFHYHSKHWLMRSQLHSNLSSILIGFFARLFVISGHNQREHFLLFPHFIHKIDKLCDFSMNLWLGDHVAHSFLSTTIASQFESVTKPRMKQLAKCRYIYLTIATFQFHCKRPCKRHNNDTLKSTDKSKYSNSCYCPTLFSFLFCFPSALTGNYRFLLPHSHSAIISRTRCWPRCRVHGIGTQIQVIQAECGREARSCRANGKRFTSRKTGNTSARQLKNTNKNVKTL